jgi:hypothetical protein
MYVMTEANAVFTESNQAAACPRLRLRKGFKRSFTVDGEPVAFEVALLGVPTAALVRTAAMPVAPLLADAPLRNAAELRGKVAVVQRGGGVRFEEKVRRAQAVGAAALVVINTDDDLSTMSDLADLAGDIMI